MKTPKHNDSSARSGLFRVAVIGAASLKGKEVKEVLSERSFPSTDVRLLDDEESLGQIENVGDEPTFIQRVLPEHVDGVDFTFFASDSAYTKNVWQMAQRANNDIIDLSFGLDGNPDAQLRASWIDRELKRNFQSDLMPAPVVIAHPAAVVLALIMIRLQRTAPIRLANATILEPASEQGKPGMDELHDQTVNLLSFQQMPTGVFGTQVAFNVVSSYGEDTHPTLASIEERIATHYKMLVGDAAPVPSMVLLQAPVFHGHTFSIYIELDSPLAVGDFEAAIAGEHIQITRADERPNNVNVAGADDIQVAVRPDAARPNGFWLWVAGDNLRIMATLAVEAAEQMTSTRPRGKVQ